MRPYQPSKWANNKRCNALVVFFLVNFQYPYIWRKYIVTQLSIHLFPLRRSQNCQVLVAGSACRSTNVTHFHLELQTITTIPGVGEQPVVNILSVHIWKFSRCFMEHVLVVLYQFSRLASSLRIYLVTRQSSQYVMISSSDFQQNISVFACWTVTALCSSRHNKAQ
jgi:hypothetical protein